MTLLRIEKHCNQNCLFCGADPKNTQDLTSKWSDIQHILDNVASDEAIEISGGEPTLSPMLPKLLDYIRQKQRRASIQSNAMRFADPDFTASLVNAGLTDCFVSLHAATEALSDYLTRRPGGFRLTLKGIRNLLDQGVSVTLNYVICTPNMRHMSEYVRVMHRLFGSKVELVFSVINPYYRAWQTPALIPKITDFQAELHAALDECRKLGVTGRVPDICGIPICFLKGYEDCADKYMTIQQQYTYTKHPDKAHADACEHCVFQDRCDGHWTRYYMLYGGEEFQPYTSEPTVIQPLPRAAFNRNRKLDES